MTQTGGAIGATAGCWPRRVAIVAWVTETSKETSILLAY